jgi:SagB-type dehydrogenase family enzyme
MIFLLILSVVIPALLFSADLEPVKLNPPSPDRGLSVMKALAVRASVREYSSRDLTLQDLSDLLWSANGINRPDKGMRTASSAMNAQDIDVYVILSNGAYIYNAQENRLDPVSPGSFSDQIGTQPYVKTAPVNLILVSDLSRFRHGDDETKHTYAAIDAGIVSQNISLFCAAAGLRTVPRAGIDIKRMREVLKLKDSQVILLNHPVGYPK